MSFPMLFSPEQNVQNGVSSPAGSRTLRRTWLSVNGGPS